MKILVVEDTAEMQTALSRILRTRAHEVVIAENGLEAMARLGDGGFDAIVCDLALPFLQGNRFYEQLRAGYPAIADRVVFVTGFATETTTKDFLEKTGQPYLAKPFEATDLLAALERVTTRPEDRPG